MMIIIIIIITVNNLMRQWNTSYQHAQYWQKNSTYRDMIVCAELHVNICKEIGVKLDNKHWYDRVPKSVETSHEGKVPSSANRQNYS
jgi:hypothetical protein